MSARQRAPNEYEAAYTRSLQDPARQLYQTRASAPLTCPLQAEVKCG